VELELIFRLRLQASKLFWPQLQHLQVFGSVMIRSIENHSIICTKRLPHKLGMWKRNPNFRFRLHQLVVFGSDSTAWFEV